MSDREQEADRSPGTAVASLRMALQPQDLPSVEGNISRI